MATGVAICQPDLFSDPAMAEMGEGLRPLSMFMKEDAESSAEPCYDRETQPQTAVTDLHLQPNPLAAQAFLMRS